MENMEMIVSAPDMNNFIERINWNKEELKEAVSSVVAEVKGGIYSDDQIKLAKDHRAKLNSLKKNLNDRRIEVAKTFKAPLELFESEVKEVIAIIDPVVCEIDNQVKSFEDKQKAEKKAAIEAYWSEKVAAIESEDKNLLDLRRIFDLKWLNATTSMKKCKDSIDEFLARFTTDIETINNTGETADMLAVVKGSYVSNGYDLSRAFDTLNKLREQRELERKRKKEAEERARQEELKKQALAKLEAVEQPEPVKENHAEEAKNQTEAVEDQGPNTWTPGGGEYDDSEPVIEKLQTSFTVRGTLEQLKALKAYMIQAGIEVIA